MDENAPPGYLSPFGLLAGIRNMLPGGGKDQTIPDKESPNRSILRDVNSSEGPKPKNLLSVARLGPAQLDSSRGALVPVSAAGRSGGASVASQCYGGRVVVFHFVALKSLSAIRDWTPPLYDVAAGGRLACRVVQRGVAARCGREAWLAPSAGAERTGDICQVRCVLRDHLMSVALQAQGAEGSSPSSPGSLNGDCSIASSPGQGERRSVASDTSFVSAVSGFSRSERPESDSSDSCFETSYVSAAESSGNITFLGDQFSKLVLNSPAPHSNFVNGSSEKPSVKSLNAWPGLELSSDETLIADNGTAFGQTEREGNVDTQEEANLISSNQTCSGSSHSDLDATFEDVHGNDDVNQTQILNEKSVNLEIASENKILNDTELVSVPKGHIEGAPSSDESSVECGLNSTFTGNSEISNNFTTSVGVDEATALALSKESVDSAQPIKTENLNINVTFDGVPAEQAEENSTGNETVTTEDLNNSEWRDLVNGTQILSPTNPYPVEPNSSVNPNINVTFDAPIGIEGNVTGNETVHTEDLNNSEWRDLVNGTQILSPTDPYPDEPNSSVNPNINVTFDAPIGIEGNVTGNETVHTEDLNNSEWQDKLSDSIFLCQGDIGRAEEEVDLTPHDTVNECQEIAQHSQGADDIPLPIKKQRTFEEILAAELAAHCDPEQAVPCFSDEIPLPIKKPRTFEEILEAELASQRDPEQAVPSFSENSETTSEISVTSVNVLAEKDETLTEKETHAFAGSPAGDQENLCKSEAPPADLVREAPSHQQEDVCQADSETITHHSDSLSPEQDSSHCNQCADEIPLPIKKHRTFEEILAAELAAQSDPEQAVPSFSASPRKLEESFANIISADTSPLESECEPELALDSVPAELDSEADSGLESIIQRAKQQEKDLEENLRSVSEEASQISSSYLNESERACSITSEELESPDCANQTVIELNAKADSTLTNSDVASEVQAQASASFGDSALGENFGAEDFESGDAFKDPSAFDFLSLHGCSRSARDLRKESLYVKFDPLVGSFISDTRADNSLIMHPENSSETQAGAACGQDQALNTSVKLVSLSPSASKQQAEETAQDAALITPIKTMPSRGTSVKTPAHIMLNETLESIGSRGTLVKQEDLIKKLQEHQAVLEEQDKAYQERISELEQRLQEMDIRQAEERSKELKEKDKELQEKVQSLSELNVIMKEYEKTISRLVAEKSQEKAALEEKQVELVKDRDQAQQHLNNMEIAFSDIHTKYERLKSVVTALKKNEETLNAALAEKQENFDKMQNMYDMLKSHAVSKLEKANQDLESIKQKHQQENSKLKAMVKKLEVKTKSLEEALEQKVKENQALTAICDELINKVGE
ncbi:Transforming acidic coiled-coil-containing protein 2 [Frankliniella fusca]|uniref:Transforming acidic coiled-coil-containing protein 2 n=1 Tax=Frankliniella fusca TaxID=407009 RepID=A0AAE1H3W4_9NEOP|nr:Transforming acidic coiled-coil-containing protein 2 [Frankliniella fusca]